MAIEHPHIDHRTFNDIVQQILGDPTTGLGGLRDYYTCDFKSTSQNRDDPGVVLTLLFGKLMEIVLERLNRIPEKNFIAFLDLLGIDRLPGNWARTPVQFLLPAGNQTGGFVPASTQLATSPTESGQVYIFETEKGLFISPALLKKIFSLVPSSDRYTDIALTRVDIPVVPGETPVEHSLYLAHDTLLGFSEPVVLTLDIQIVQPSPPFVPTAQNWQVLWQRFVEDATGKGLWETMVPAAGSSSSAAQLLASGTIKFVFPGTARSLQGKPERGGGEAHWIRALLNTPLTPELIGTTTPSENVPLPQIAALKLGVRIDRSALSFDAAFQNNIPIDLSKDFHPFGEEPRLADTFYLASTEAFSKPGAQVTIRIELSRGMTVVPSPNLLLRWEAWNGNQWEEITEIQDDSNKFSTGIQGRPGVITLTLPQELAKLEYNGVSSNWIRVRIIQGNYGNPAQYIPVPRSSPVQFVFTPASFQPPVLSHIDLEYQISYPLGDPQECFTLNNFIYQDQSHQIFYPFLPVSEQDPALYFGFDKAFGDVAISLFFPITEQDSGQPGIIIAEASPQVSWEYSTTSSDTGWSRLEVEDSTNHFTTSGSVSFIGPNDFSQVEQFGENLFWLRARFRSGILPANRLMQGIFFNTIWAANRATIQDEVMGSGNGKARQSLAFSQKPVLLGEKLYVKESEVPSEEARHTLEAMEKHQLGRMLTAEEKNNLVQVVTSPLTQEKEIWVRWHRVDSFFGSNAQSRHYILDRINGVATFGDGQKGLIPPIGRDNIKVFFYQAGGGLLANKEVKAGIINELRSSLPFVDTVTNVVAASGGSDPESVEDVLERGPQTIKNRDRAVTSEDFVWLARQASTLVHQVKCLPTQNDTLQFEAGAVTLLLVPESEEARPRPSQELIRTVKDYVQQRALSALQLKIYIIPPMYQDVRVTADVVATIPEEASVVEGRIVNRLNIFLHPIKGGPKAQGWEFGRNVYISEIHQLLEDTPGVDVVLSVELNENPAWQEIEIGENELPASGSHNITMKTLPS